MLTSLKRGTALMRKLTLLVSAVLFTETLLYVALSPLLPALTQGVRVVEG